LLIHNPCRYTDGSRLVHVYYNEYMASVDIRTCEIIEGELPRRQTKLVLAWAELHQEALLADWQLIMNGEEPFRIPPLR